MILLCPGCGSPVGDLATSGTQTLFCANCRFKYQVVSGTVTSKSSRAVANQQQTNTKQAKTYVREYEFRLAEPHGALDVVTFRIPGREDRFSARRDDVISIVHTMRENVTEDLVALINQTTNTVTRVGRPGQIADQKAFGFGCFTGIILAAGLIVGDVSAWVAVPAGAVVCLTIAWVLQDKLQPRHEFTPSQQAALAQSATLLQQKAALVERISGVENDRREKIGIRDKLLALRAKMHDVDAELYQTRIDRIDSAVPLLDEQLALDQKLIDACTRSLKMVEIELESQSASEEILEEVTGELHERAQEIAEIEARTADVKLLLAANEEVDRFLREG